MYRVLLPFAVATTLVMSSTVYAQRFLPDDPVLRDHDDLHIPLPGKIELSTGYDVIENSLFRSQPEASAIGPARNVNTLGEVPDSSWWTNRIGAREMTLEDLARGPNEGDGPDVEGPWTVISGKAAGITPGFAIRDSRGDVYFVKVDPARYFGLATGADLVGSKFFHAFGYFVPETWIVYVQKHQIRVGEQARIRVLGSKPRKMVQEDLDQMLDNVARRTDGRIRFVASKAVPGKVVGPHKYFGTRPDDPNDVIPHEDRRELRGYRVFSAWLNHDDSRSLNSLDTYVEENGRGYLRHYLQDFSSMLGSGSDWRRSIAPQNPRAGNEYIIELAPMLKTIGTLGVWQRPWYRVRYDIHPEVGAIEADYFQPERWKPEFPNAAFDRMLPEDAFWAARIVSRFGDDAIRAILREADYGSPTAEEHLARMIIRRRDKVLAHYFRLLNPLGDFRVGDTPAGPVLTFTNHGEEAGLGRVDAYEHQWFRFDNDTGEVEALAAPARTTARTLIVPSERRAFLMVRIRSLGAGAGNDAWGKKVDVFLRTSDGLTVVGIDRES